MTAGSNDSAVLLRRAVKRLKEVLSQVPGFMDA